MSSRRRRILGVIAVLAGLQLALVAGFRWSSASGRERSLSNVVPVAAPTPLGAVLVDVRSTGVALQRQPRPTLVHVWATWCKPCRDELPELLRESDALRDNGIDVVLVSVDESWPVIDHYFEQATPATVVRMNHEEARRALGVEAMPTTVLLDGNGRLTHRLAGAQPWSSSKARAELFKLAGTVTHP